MANEAGDASDFSDFIDRLNEERLLGIDEQSDMSISSVHTSDLSDFNAEISDLAESSRDNEVDRDAEWSATITDFDKRPFRGKPGPKVHLCYNYCVG